MFRTLSIVLIIATAPLALAAVPAVCSTLSGGTCAGTIPVVAATEIGAGQTAVFNQPAYVVAGLIVVKDGGLMLVTGTTMDFDSDAAGILVESGGILQIAESTLQSAAGSVGAQDPFELVAELGSNFTLDNSTVTGGTVRVAAVDAVVDDVTFADTPQALVLEGVTSTLSALSFQDSASGVEIIGGSPKMKQSDFAGTEACIRVENATFTLQQSTLQDCMFGILSFTSVLSINANAIADREDPFSRGLQLMGGSADVNLNVFQDWGKAIVVDGGTLNEWDNTFTNNLVDIEYV